MTIYCNLQQNMNNIKAVDLFNKQNQIKLKVFIYLYSLQITTQYQELMLNDINSL